VNPTGTAEIPLILTGQQQGPISDSGVLSAAEVVTVQGQVTAFNQVIAAQASAAHATLVDINALFNQLFATGLTINGYTGNASFLGGFFALDGIHPTNTGYAQIANTFIDAMNAQRLGRLRRLIHTGRRISCQWELLPQLGRGSFRRMRGKLSTVLCWGRGRSCR